MNFPGDQWDKSKNYPGTYFDQGSYYISGNGEIRRVENIAPRHAQNAMKRYRRSFPQHVKHINRTKLGIALRKRYLAKR